MEEAREIDGTRRAGGKVNVGCQVSLEFTTTSKLTTGVQTAVTQTQRLDDVARRFRQLPSLFSPPTFLLRLFSSHRFVLRGPPCGSPPPPSSSPPSPTQSPAMNSRSFQRYGSLAADDRFLKSSSSDSDSPLPPRRPFQPPSASTAPLSTHEGLQQALDAHPPLPRVNMAALVVIRAFPILATFSWLLTLTSVRPFCASSTYSSHSPHCTPNNAAPPHLAHSRRPQDLHLVPRRPSFPFGRRRRAQDRLPRR